jgi:hypothetical protein
MLHDLFTKKGVYMFPFPQTGFVDGIVSHPHEALPSRRIDVQRDSLEYKKMYHLNTMAVEQSFSDRDRDLAVRQQIDLATSGRVTLVSRIRVGLATVLISAGQRIRPEAAMVEPRYNG